MPLERDTVGGRFLQFAGVASAGGGRVREQARHPGITVAAQAADAGAGYPAPASPQFPLGRIRSSARRGQCVVDCGARGHRRAGPNTATTCLSDLGARLP
ncbi:hypothetical protein [Rhodanobacter aciditrophus]|uniref:hypothetical protein n=1 Tax=Rhodanobacter aciditrophus TaxID=1623218 RepID=UPI003CF11773